MTEVEFASIKALYDTIADENSASYEAFRQKLHRLAANNPRTYNRLSRRLGIEPVRRRSREHPLTTYTPPMFIAYDGEGWNDKFVLLGNSLKERISNPEGLSTVDCLEYLNIRYAGTSKRVFFSFGYDVNHILKDLPDEGIQTLLAGKSYIYEGYRLSFIPGKIFVVNGLRYYDLFSFFSTSFINVVRQMLGEEYVTESLVAGKAGRGSFETWDLDKIIQYNDEELDLLVKIASKLRLALHGIDVYITEWYGPGAIAKYWFKEHGVEPKEKLTGANIKALNSAYYGGRFEQIKLGTFNNIYEYDIHSAYPSVMVEMPYFRSWQSVRKFQKHPYSIWYLSFDLREDAKRDNSHQFLPLPVRSKDGRICFPLMGKGWYWYPEVRVLLDYFPTAKITFHRGYVATTEGRPFDWVRPLYNYRQRLKDSGNLSQYAIKVGLNSLYGKCAQRVGRSPYFSLAWAGYITSFTRAKLARAGYEVGSQHVIGFATDALFTDNVCKLPLSDNLGDWEESSFSKATFFQSGVYRLTKADGHSSDRYRGSPLRRGIDDIIAQLNKRPAQYPTIRIGRFISHMLAIKAPKAYGPHRLQFIQVEHRLALDAPYKRHYYDFLDRIDSKGKIHSNYAKLLTEPIRSLPKVFAGDNNPFLTNEYLYDKLPVFNIESQPPPMKDTETQRLLDEGNLVAVMDGDITEVSDLETLPLLEDESM
jgi:hypothetical protein